MGAVRAGLWFLAGHPIAVATSVIALTLGVAAEVAGPFACLVDAAVIATAAFGPRSMGWVPWSWSHACRFRRRLPRCHRPRSARTGACRVADRLETFPRFHDDGTQTWVVQIESVDDAIEADQWLRTLAIRDGKVAAIESVVVTRRPLAVEMRLRPCGPGAWSVRSADKPGASTPVQVAPEPDPPGPVVLGGDDDQIRLGAPSDAGSPVDTPSRQRHPMPDLPDRRRKRGRVGGAEGAEPGSAGVA